MEAFFNEEKRLVKVVENGETTIREIGGDASAVSNADELEWVPIDPAYNQLCVFQNYPRQKVGSSELVSRMASQFSLRLKYAESVSHGGDCMDVLFFVHGDDIGKFVAGPKRKYKNIKWFEEASTALPDAVQKKYPKFW